jgi:hypothetical protein
MLSASVEVLGDSGTGRKWFSASHDLEGLPEKRNRHPFRTER